MIKSEAVVLFTGRIQFGGVFSFVPLGLHHIVEFFEGASQIVMSLTKGIEGEGKVVIKDVNPETVNRVVLSETFLAELQLEEYLRCEENIVHLVITWVQPELHVVHLRVMRRVNHVLQIRPERVEVVEWVDFDSKHLIDFVLHDLDGFAHDSGHPKVASVFRKQQR